jgi:xylulokinase
MTDCVVGIDLGTSLVKAGVYTIEGALLGSASVPLAMHQGAGGRVEQSMTDFSRAAAVATRRSLDHADVDTHRITALAVAGQMAGVGLVDRRHRPVAPFDSWLDTRCAPVVDELSATYGDRIVAGSGCPPTISIGPKMVWWHRAEPTVCDHAAAFVTAGGYVAGDAAGLAGDAAFIDPTYLHFTSVAAVAEDAWDIELVAELGLEPELLPTIVPSTQVVGELTRRAAERYGLPAGIPIAAGCGDTAASALGSAVTQPGAGFDIAGTAAVLGVCQPVFAPDTINRTLMVMRAALPGLYYSLAYVAGAGQVIEWLCREFFGDANSAGEAYEKLAAAAAEAGAGSGGVTALPHFTGRVAPAAPADRGALVGITPASTRGDLARAVLESIAYEYRGYAELVGKLTPDVVLKGVTGMGGGSRSALWNQIKADVLGVQYRPLVNVDAGTRGAAVLALIATGRNGPEIGSDAYGHAAAPDASTATAYDGGYERYRFWSSALTRAYRKPDPSPETITGGD